MDARVRAAITLMRINLARNLTTVEIASRVRLSPARLRQLFKDHIGMSVARYQRELRLERAKHLFETTFLSVKEIAASVGLTSVGHFIVEFQKKYGDTPARYAGRHGKAIQVP
jgi:transcriptional regulator GlxA family with amidase domain